MVMVPLEEEEEEEELELFDGEGTSPFACLKGQWLGMIVSQAPQALGELVNQTENCLPSQTREKISCRQWC